ncbi:heat shock protein HslJ [Rhodoglobus vestalii]|uniref:Heat shock protein HslJ n=1 Tax=Rhodoglobus vestalii TaxID=193384 RepID=A0A8H2PUS2_9MICO|nr:META domain-containing protein [Rhodoglobus vestalii]TQO20826.1 heat shock protein HslJ [Rhodoglobus vestalii]
MSTTMLTKIAPLLAVGLLALSACAGPAVDPGAVEPTPESEPGLNEEETPGDPIPVEGIDGTWTFAEGIDSAGDLSSDATVTLVIAGTSISGSAACNNYTATFTGEPSELTVGAVASTKRACPSALMGFDRRYFSALALVTAAVPTGGSLVLQGEGVAMNFLPKNFLPEG